MRFKEFLLQEADDVEYPPFREIISHVGDEMDQIKNEHKKHVTKGDSVPAGPDTSKFKASRGGMIDIVEKLNVPAGRYGVDKYFAIAIKVGGKVSSDVHKKIAGEVKDMWDEVIEHNKEFHPQTVDGKTLITEEGYRLSHAQTSGTNWSAYGISARKGK